MVYKDKPKLLDQIREVIRLKHYSLKTEKSYVHWGSRFILFHKKRHPHSLRHFFATYKIKNEKLDIKAVSSYLGHSTTSITLNMYVNTSLKPEEIVII